MIGSVLPDMTEYMYNLTKFCDMLFVIIVFLAVIADVLNILTGGKGRME